MVFHARITEELILVKFAVLTKASRSCCFTTAARSLLMSCKR